MSDVDRLRCERAWVMGATVPVPAEGAEGAERFRGLRKLLTNVENVA